VLLKKIKGILKNTISVSLALFLIFNASLGVLLVQRSFHRKEINRLVSYMETLAEAPDTETERLRSAVLPEEGVNIGIKWGDLGKRLVDTGVIDEEKYLSLFKFSEERVEYGRLLGGYSDEYIVLNEQNSRFVLNTLWALGLLQNSDVLMDMQTDYDQVGSLASTGGWSIGQASAMTYYGQGNLLNLTDEQQQMVSDITKNIYRPCCNNHTAFADCNHGMAMLGLVELMVANGYSEKQIYDTALKANSYWFPDTYMTLANYFETKQNTKWEDVDAKLALGVNYSSGSGIRNVAAQVQPLSGSGGGGGCGV
jgi:cytochrome c-type biogenesis protein CcmH/NrfF